MAHERDSSIAIRDRKLPPRENRMDIIESILKNSNESSKKTRLRYKCNLNSSQFNLYKEFLVEAGLLNVFRREDGVEILETTEKGKQFLKEYVALKTSLRA